PHRRGLPGRCGLRVVPAGAVGPPARPDGHHMKRLPIVLGFALLAAWPLLTPDVFLQRIGALVLLAAISASAWNLIGGYAGQVSVGHAVYFGAGAYSSLVVYTEF